MRRPRLPRPSMVMLPNGFTLANLFFGIFAIVTAARGDFDRAPWYILIGGLCDIMDGRVARATGTGSPFGEELDSLVDAISFGLAPAMMVYFSVLSRKTGWDWVFVFLFAACAVMRLARFNIEQAGRPKTHFRGLPSPVAGGVLATQFWFSQTPWYYQTGLGDIPQHAMIRFLMAGLSFLMISNVPYPAWPTFSLRTVRGVLGLAFFLAVGVGLIFLPKHFFFAVGMLYVLVGVVAAVIKGLVERQPSAEEEDDDDEEEFAAVSSSYEDNPASSHPQSDGDAQRRRRRRRRRPRGGSHSTERNSSEDLPA